MHRQNVFSHFLTALTAFSLGTPALSDKPPATTIYLNCAHRVQPQSNLEIVIPVPRLKSGKQKKKSDKIQCVHNYCSRLFSFCFIKFHAITYLKHHHVKLVNSFLI